MSPVMGQGLNSGMEDVAVFAQCLEQQQGDVDAALPAYNKARLPDIQAIMTINEVVASFDVGLASQVQPACLPCLPLPDWLAFLTYLLGLPFLACLSWLAFARLACLCQTGLPCWLAFLACLSGLPCWLAFLTCLSDLPLPDWLAFLTCLSDLPCWLDFLTCLSGLPS